MNCYCFSSLLRCSGLFLVGFLFLVFGSRVSFSICRFFYPFIFWLFLPLRLVCISSNIFFAENGYITVSSDASHVVLMVVTGMLLFYFW